MFQYSKGMLSVRRRRPSNQRPLQGEKWLISKQIWCDMANNSKHICSLAGLHLCQVLYCLPQIILVFVSRKLLFLLFAQNLCSFVGCLFPHRCYWHFVRIIRLHLPKLISSHPECPSRSPVTRARQELPHLLDVFLNVTLIQRGEKVLRCWTHFSERKSHVPQLYTNIPPVQLTAHFKKCNFAKKLKPIAEESAPACAACNTLRRTHHVELRLALTAIKSKS